LFYSPVHPHRQRTETPDARCWMGFWSGET
jgi:hypothetical protein